MHALPIEDEMSNIILIRNGWKLSKGAGINLSEQSGR
jgi:hypothetical protein